MLPRLRPVLRRLPRRRAVQLVDCDVHAQATEAMLARYLGPCGPRACSSGTGGARRAITEWYPRARHAGMRVDAWPGKPGHIWGSDPELTARAVARRVRHGLRGARGAQRAGLLRPPGLRGGVEPRDQRVAARDVAGVRPAAARRRSPCRTSTRSSRSRRSSGAPPTSGSSRCCCPASAAEQLGAPKYWPIYERRDRVRAAGGVPHRRLRRPPRRGLSVVLPRVPRRQRHRHAEPARRAWSPAACSTRCPACAWC